MPWLAFEVRNQTLPQDTAMTTAVDKWPACARALGGRSGGPITHRSYTTPQDTTTASSAARMYLDALGR